MLTEELLKYAGKYWGPGMVEEEILREEKFPLVDIQTTIAWLMIKKHVSERSINTVLDAGAGFGRYSIPMAKFGYQVTHLDISEAMLILAKQIAQKEEIKNINFMLSDITSLKEIKNRQYDFTLCFDAPISYVYPRQFEAIDELCRVTDKLAMFMVSGRSGVLPYMIDFDLSREYLPKGYKKKIDPFYITKQILANGVEKWPDEIKTYLEQNHKDAPLDYSFKVDELITAVEQNGFKVLEIGGPGALARSIKPESLEKIRSDERLFNQFIEFSLNYDFDKYNLGLGAVNILIIAERV